MASTVVVPVRSIRSSRLSERDDQVVEAGRPRRLDRRLDAHAALGQLLIGPALDPEAEFLGPVPGEGEMGVGVDEPGQGHQAPGIDRHRVRLGRHLVLELVLGPGEDDDALGRRDPAVLDGADLPQALAALGQRPGAGHELAAAGDDEIS